MIRYSLIFIALLIGIFLSVNQNVAMAKDFPEHEIRLIVPTGPGGGLDRMARSVQRFLPDILNVQVLVENRKGAGGFIAYKYYMKQPADGYTIMVMMQPALTLLKRKKPDFVKIEDLSPININWVDPMLIAARKSLGWNSLDDMVNAIKKEPGKYSFALPGKTSTGTLMCKILFEKLNLDVRMVPYTSGGSARTAVRGGHVDMTTGGVGSMMVIEDVVTALGIFWNHSFPSWPKTPPINEKLQKYGVQVPDAASLRFFAVNSIVKQKYPERYETLVRAFQKLVTEHEPFIKFCNETEISHDWYGASKSQELILKSDETFSKIKLPKKKK